ncbi:MAG: acyltransferase [Tannerella sp.]|jgi:hypothetical protein|nr:acyltransferase [Tannerella sp.]
MNTLFDDLRPYHQSEIAPAMQRIADSEHFRAMSRFIFPGKEVEDIRRMVRSIRTTDEFQFQVMYCFNQSVLDQSVDQFTYDGLEHLDPDKCYLFVSNHRDIMLDSSLTQFMFRRNGFRTTEISFGSNLMSSQLVIDIGKSNKMYTVIRGGNIRDFYHNSMHLSGYIRYAVTEKKESVWIAQRNGRTKDGNDTTDQGIIKMFCMSDASDLLRSAEALNLTPLAISYQIEPCDMLKMRELYLSRNGKKYVKQPGEDMNSVLTGIMQPKGNIHISICKPIGRDELAAIAHAAPNEFHKRVAALIDRRIYQGYKLHADNYIAHDIRSGRDTCAVHYTPEQKAGFLTRYEHAVRHMPDGDMATLRSIYLGIYANPVDKSADAYFSINESG